MHLSASLESFGCFAGSDRPGNGGGARAVYGAGYWVFWVMTHSQEGPGLYRAQYIYGNNTGEVGLGLRGLGFRVQGKGCSGCTSNLQRYTGFHQVAQVERRLQIVTQLPAGFQTGPATAPSEASVPPLRPTEFLSGLVEKHFRQTAMALLRFSIHLNSRARQLRWRMSQI